MCAGLPMMKLQRKTYNARVFKCAGFEEHVFEPNNTASRP